VTRSASYFPTLDGWRAFAIFFVILFHGRFVFFPASSPLWPIAEHGYLGVDLFFALSGFLICSRLLAEHKTTGSINLQTFYIRRVFRIVPPYLAALASFVLLSIVAQIPLERWETLSCLLFFRNYEPSVGPAGGPYTAHFWSLAVEEHFYLFWPLLLKALRPGKARVTAIVLCGVVFGWNVIAHLWLAPRQPLTPVQARTDCRIDSLLWGCLAALYFPKIQELFAHPRWRNLWLFVLLALVGLEMVHPIFTPLALNILFPCLLLSTVIHPASILGRLLEWKPLRWIGALSYSMYLWQQLFLQPRALAGSIEARSGFAHLQVWPWNVVLILATASTSYYLLEQPAIRLGHQLARSLVRRSVAAAPPTELAPAGAYTGSTNY
jgi:peptidoglycan/LPS O-acetylase OafA/YrhL